MFFGIESKMMKTQPCTCTLIFIYNFNVIQELSSDEILGFFWLSLRSLWLMVSYFTHNAVLIVVSGIKALLHFYKESDAAAL